MNVLAFDISTSIIGFSVIEIESGELLSIGFLKPEGNSREEKIVSALNQFEKYQLSNISAIYAEAPNMMFRSGFSSAQVIATILRFNGAFLFELYQKFHLIPQEVMATSARKQVIGIGRFPKGTNTKQEILKWVQSRISISWPIIEKGKHKGELKSESYDMADSYIIGLYGVKNEQKKMQSL